LVVELGLCCVEDVVSWLFECVVLDPFAQSKSTKNRVNQLQRGFSLSPPT